MYIIVALRLSQFIKETNTTTTTSILSEVGHIFQGGSWRSPGAGDRRLCPEFARRWSSACIMHVDDVASFIHHRISTDGRTDGPCVRR